MVKLVGLGTEPPLKSPKKYKDIISLSLYCGVSMEQLDRLVPDWGLPREEKREYDSRYTSIRQDFSEINIQRALLLTGSYGDFPPITAPNTDTYMWVCDVQEFNSKTDIVNIVDYVARLITEVSPFAITSHKGMYSVVNFLTCIRHEIIAADMKLRDVPWNPLVSFTAPFYYREGDMRKWCMDNNILKSEIIEFIYNVYYLLISVYKTRSTKPCNEYQFYPLAISEDDIKKYKTFEYIEPSEIISTVCFVISKMQHCLDVMQNMLKRRPIEQKTAEATPDTLFQSLQTLFQTVNRLMSYVYSL